MCEPSFDVLKFDSKEIQIQKQLGKLTFLGKLKSSNRNFVFRFSEQNTPQTNPVSFFSRVSNIEDLWTPSLVPISCATYSKERKQFIIASRLFSNGNLGIYLESDKSYKQWTPTVGAKTLIGLAHALRQVHSRFTQHGSIQPAKIVYDEKMNPHLIDVWISESPQDVKYIAPEMMNASAADPKQADIFAFALIYYHIVAELSPFDGIYQANIGPYFFSGQRPPIPQTVSRFSRNLIMQCWHHDPKQRPTAEILYQTLLEHFNEIIPNVNFPELTAYVKLLMKYPTLSFLAKMGDSKSCEKMGNYLKDQDVIQASEHYLNASKTYKMNAAPKISRTRNIVDQKPISQYVAANDDDNQYDTIDELPAGLIPVKEEVELPQPQMPPPIKVPDNISPPMPMQIGSNIMKPMGQPIPVPEGQIMMQPVMVNGQIFMQPMMVMQNQPPQPAQQGKKKSSGKKQQSKNEASQISYYDVDEQMKKMRRETQIKEEKSRIEMLRLQEERRKVEEMRRENERIKLENERLLKQKAEDERIAKLKRDERMKYERKISVQFADQESNMMRNALARGRSMPPNVNSIDTVSLETTDSTMDSSLSFNSISRDESENSVTSKGKKSKKSKKMPYVQPKAIFSQETDTIFEAAEKGDMNDIMRFIEEDHVNPNMQDQFKSTPLHLSCENGHEGASFYLVSHGADVNKTDKWHKTPLHWAAQGGYVQIIKMLLSNGADINAQDKWGGTPLQLAAEKNQYDAVQLLLSAGSDPMHKDGSGKTPYDVTTDSSIRETLRNAARV